MSTSSFMAKSPTIASARRDPGPLEKQPAAQMGQPFSDNSYVAAGKRRDFCPGRAGGYAVP
jgi:hypothetical protein